MITLWYARYVAETPLIQSIQTFLVSLGRSSYSGTYTLAQWQIYMYSTEVASLRWMYDCARLTCNAGSLGHGIPPSDLWLTFDLSFVASFSTLISLVGSFDL